MKAERPQGLYPGYAVGAVSTLALVLTAPGQTMLVSLLNLPLRKTFAIDPLWLNTSYTVATVLASLPLVAMGKLIDRYGPRRMFVVVAIAFGCGCVFMSLVAHVAMLVVAFFLLRFLGQGSLTLVSSHALAMWFHRRLGTVSGFRSVALFVAWVPLPSLTLAMFDVFGWRTTWALYGVFVAATVSIASWLFVRDRPEDLGLEMDGGATFDTPPEPEVGLTLTEAMQTRAYWILAFTTTLPPMIGTAMIFDIQPLLAARNVDAQSAAYAVSAWSLTMALMALPSGRLVDKFAPGPIIASGMMAIIGSCLVLLWATSMLTAIAGMCTYAVGQSLVASAIGTTTARYFGRRHHGAIRSSLSRVGVIATGLGPLLFGLSQHFTGAYDVALIGFAALCLPASAASLLLVRPASANS